MKLKKKRFTLEKKMVACVRYYEYMYVIRDGAGERIYTGSDEKLARRTISVLNAYRARQEWKARKARPKRRKVRRKSRK